MNVVLRASLRTAACTLAVAVSVGCGGPPKAPGAAPESPAPGPADPPLRGMLASRSGSFTFLPCGAPPLDSVAVGGATDELAAAWRALSPPPDATLYCEIRGDVAANGASVAVTDLVRARSADEVSLCDSPVFDGDFVIDGNEPSWRIEIRRDAIVYRSLAEPNGRRFPYSARPTDSGAIEYATKIDAPKVSTLVATIRPGRCVDSMSGEIRSYKAHVEIDGKSLDGCAAAGVPPGGFGDGPLDELERYAGTDPSSVDLWSIEPWRSRLATLLGTKLPTFRAAMRVAGPLSKDAGVYYALGSKPRTGGSARAIFMADPEEDVLEVVLLENGRRTDFKENGRDVILPTEVRSFLQNGQGRPRS